MKRFAIPITVSPAFWIVSFVIGWMVSNDLTGGLLWIFVVLISVLFHEMGHAVTAVCFGQKARIELGFLGGITYRQGPELTKAQELLIVMMGPFCSLLLALISWQMFSLASGANTMLGAILHIFLVANLIWSVLNLVPVLPLDGGRIMQIVLEALFGHRGERASYLVSACTATFLMVLGIYFGAVIIGCLFLLFAFDSYKIWQKKRFVRCASDERTIVDELAQADQDWALKHPESAITRLEKICQKMPTVEAIMKLARYLLMTENPNKAMYYLSKVESRLPVDGLKLMQLAAYENMEWKRALDLGEKTFLEEGGDVSCALLNALSSARLSLAETSINWLISATKKGSVDMKKVLDAEDFDLIRSSPSFIEYTKSAR